MHLSHVAHLIVVHLCRLKNKKMIRFTLLPLAVMLSCGSTKTNQSATKSDTVVVGNPKNTIEQDSINNSLSGKMVSVELTLPTCIKNKIDSFKVIPKHEQPQKITEYIYKGKKVYYVTMPCCDFFNEVYDDKCKLLGSPDVGFIVKGDGKLRDVFKDAKNEKLSCEAAK